MAEREVKSQTVMTAAFAVGAVVCLIAFLAYRGEDIGKLPTLISNLGGGPLFGWEGFRDSLIGAVTAVLIGISWIGLGGFLSSFIKISKPESRIFLFDIAGRAAVGGAIWSLIWFFLGLAGAYSGLVATASVVIGLALAVITLRRSRPDNNDLVEPLAVFDKLLVAIIGLPLFLAFVAALAPPIAKDTLLYHFSVPKAFIAQNGSAFVEGNIANYLALGSEMHVVWAMLLGGFVNARAAEVAAGATTFLYFPLLLIVIFGWSRELGISRRWALIAAATVATIPTAFHVASSGYIDLALAFFVTLAIYSLSRWWKSQETGSLVLTAIFLGAALSIKLTALFVFAASALVILLRARNAKTGAGKVLASGFAALILAGSIASPWYLRTWNATGSPVFPFYMSIWKGDATGWDVERSNLFQGMNTQYGGVDAEKLNYLTAPIQLSISAQPEQPANYDGVLGVAFLIGLPILIWAWWKFDLPVEAKIAAGVSSVIYLFWLFSSEQLRYLLPIFPLLAVAIAASAEAISDKREPLKEVWKYSLTTASLLGIFTSFAWFCQKAPLRVALGGETRDQYLTRNIDYYQYYQLVNNDTATDAKVWLINMRRDTYNIERPYFSDYMFEDWTLRKMVWEARSVQELRAKTAAMGIKYVLTRYDFLFDYNKSTLVDDKKPRPENEVKLKIAREFILDPANTIKADGKFSLIKVFSE